MWDAVAGLSNGLTAISGGCVIIYVYIYIYLKQLLVDVMPDVVAPLINI